MTAKLFFSALLKFTLGVILVGVLVFLPAGTFRFFGGRLFMILLFLPMFSAGIVMMIKSPELLKKRLSAKEKQREQSAIVKLSGLMFILGFVIAGLDFRFKLLPLPKAVNIAASVLFLLAYILYAEVLRENAYLSRTVEVQQGQKVISTGLYSVVRHPMYSSTLILFLSMPLVLGSLLSLAVFLCYPFIIAARIKHEEALLKKELSGYLEYTQKVKWRLVPFVW